MTGCKKAAQTLGDSSNTSNSPNLAAAPDTSNSANPTQTPITATTSPTITPRPDQSENPDQAEQTPMNVYKSVLLNKTQFFSTDVKKDLYLSQLNETVSSDSSVRAEAIKFTIIDLDKDEIPEVVLWLRVNENDYYGFEILRYQDGKVDGYTLWYRAFNNLKKDGTFLFSGSASDYGYGTITFTKDGYTIDNITYSESGIDSNNNETISYFINKESASSVEFESAIDEELKKPDAAWYDFTDENIEVSMN